MNQRRPLKLYPRALSALLLSLLLFPHAHAQTAQAQKSADATTAATASAAAQTPSEVVREFYRAMREKRLREALSMSIYRPAIEALSAQEFDELRPDFERLAADVPASIEISGEQVSGNVATVFLKTMDARSGALLTEPVTLLREGGVWLVGSSADRDLVKKHGRQFFFETRITAHHGAVQAELLQIANAQIAFYARSGGTYADFQALAGESLVPQELLTGQMLGYRFQLTLSPDRQSYQVTAEPLTYNRTGRLSFLMDAGGIKSKDVGGKPLKASAAK